MRFVKGLIRLGIVGIVYAIVCLTTDSVKALAQFDFNGDGIDEIVFLSTEGDGFIDWQSVDPSHGQRSELGKFGGVETHFAPGYWFDKNVASLGFVEHGGNSETEDLRFRLFATDNTRVHEEVMISELQRGDIASVMTGMDFDGNGISDVALVRRGHIKKARWFVSLNPFGSDSRKRNQLILGRGADLPFSWRTRSSKHSLAFMRYRGEQRSSLIEYCHLPCRRRRRVRLNPQFITNQRPSIVPSSSGQQLAFEVAISENEKQIFILSRRGKLLWGSESMSKTDQVVFGDFGANNMVVVDEHTFHFYGGSNFEFDFALGKEMLGLSLGALIKNNVRDFSHSKVGEDDNVDSKTAVPLVIPTVVSSPTFTATPTLIPTPTLTVTPTLTFTPTATPTLTPTNTATPIPELMLGGTSRSVALNQFASTDLNLGILSDLLIPDDSVEFELISAPKFGTLTFKYIYSDSGNQVNYVPQQNFQGVDQFSYRICYKFDASKSYCSVPYIYEIRVDVVKNMLSAYRDQLISVSTTLNDLLSKVRSYPSGSSDEVKVSYRGEVFALVNSLNNNLESYQIGEEEISYTQQVVVDSSPNAYNLANASWSDINNDGLLDLFVASEGRTSYLFRQRSDGTFEDITQASGIRDVLGTSALSRISSWSDYNNDGYMDLYVPIKTGMTNKLFRNNGDGTFSLASAGVETSFASGGTYSFGSSWADYNQDGLMDLSVARWGGSFPTLLFKNNGDGSFSSINDSAGITAVAGSGAMSYWADLNRDGFIDYLIARPANTGRVFISDGDGTFTALNMPADFTNLWGFSLFDVDGDGDVDIRGNGKIWVNDLDPDTKQVVFSSTTDNFEATSTEICGIFNYPTSRTDIDQDGDLDYVTGGWESKTVTINVNESYYGLEAIIGENESLPIKTKCISAHNLELISTNVNEHNLLITFDSDGESRVQKAISIVSNEIASTTELIARLP